MESTRWLRIAPLALAVAAGAVGIGRPMAGAAGDPPWEPQPCPTGEAAGPPGTTAWYRLDPVLDRQGALASARLTVGTAGERSRWVALAPVGVHPAARCEPSRHGQWRRLPRAIACSKYVPSGRIPSRPPSDTRRSRSGAGWEP